MDKWNTLTANNNFSHLNSSINVSRRKNHNKHHLARPCKKCSPIFKAVGIRRLDSLKADRGKAPGSPVNLKSKKNETYWYDI
jgi:hypothetical protein